MHKETSIKRGRVILLFQAALFIIIYIGLFILLRDKIPNVSQLTSTAEEVYAKYGYYLIFFGALIEATFILGSYIPGSFIVLLGISLARLGITSFPLVILFGTAGFCLGYSINYFLGRFGLLNLIKGLGFEKQISLVQNNLKNNYNKTLFLGYIMPSTGSMISTASGILKVRFKEFIFKTLITQTIWSLILGGLAYIFGLAFIKIFLVYFGSVAFVSYMLYLFNKMYKKGPK